jgi:hypothetical protein
MTLRFPSLKTRLLALVRERFAGGPVLGARLADCALELGTHGGIVTRKLRELAAERRLVREYNPKGYVVYSLPPETPA